MPWSGKAASAFLYRPPGSPSCSHLRTTTSIAVPEMMPSSPERASSRASFQEDTWDGPTRRMDDPYKPRQPNETACHVGTNASALSIRLAKCRYLADGHSHCVSLHHEHGDIALLTCTPMPPWMILGMWRPSMVAAMVTAARPFLRETVGRAWGARDAPVERIELAARVAGRAEGAGAKAMAPPA